MCVASSSSSSYSYRAVKKCYGISTKAEEEDATHTYARFGWKWDTVKLVSRRMSYDEGEDDMIPHLIIRAPTKTYIGFIVTDSKGNMP